MKTPLEDVFRTEGVPEYTFVRPPNYGELLVDIRNPGKPVIIEGQSGTGKTTTIRRLIQDALPTYGFEYLSARRARDMPRILDIANNTETGKFVIDDFHRLENDIQSRIGDIVKIAAEEYEDEAHPKIVIIGINKVGSELIHLVHDIAKRCGIHRIQPASHEDTSQLIIQGEFKLGIKFADHQVIFDESKGDYWLTQLICQTACLMNEITETQEVLSHIDLDCGALRSRVTERLDHAYQETVKEFCRGKRFRSSNDPYLKLLKCVGEQDSSIVDLTELANSNEDVRGSINNIKEKRLSTLIESKPVCERHFYYNSETKLFAIEDPALFYYLKHLDWETLRRSCGFRVTTSTFDFDFAISFAGENRDLARLITQQLEFLDCSVFFDELFEANYLGKAWHTAFAEVFKTRSRFVVCLLDSHYREKIWPTFERECFSPRVAEEAVIPIFLDNEPTVGIPQDTVGIPFRDYTSLGDQLPDKVTDNIVYKLFARIDSD